MSKLLVLAMYKFVALPDPAGLRDHLLGLCRERGIVGTILLAEEGLNGTIAGDPQAVREVVADLRAEPEFADLAVKESTTETPPFGRLHIRLKKEIVTLGVPGLDPARCTGVVVAPESWSELICDPEVTVIDTRNAYETSIGSFRGAIDPGLDSFRDLPRWLDRELDPQSKPKIAMYCTGGIRCEKSTAYLRARGFEQVYQLQGGILSYLEAIPPEESLWQGECFVFDRRVAIGQGLRPGTHQMCTGCGWPIPDDLYEPGPRGIVRGCPRCESSSAEGRSTAVDAKG